MGNRSGVCWGYPRIHLTFLTITVIQILLTILRWTVDFLGPLWSLILTDFLNIVFVILGFSGAYAQMRHYLFVYILWSILWLAWNIFIFLLYLPLPQLEMYKSPVLSLGTGGFSYWETRAPGCAPDWASENRLIVTNCLLDPKLVELVQSGVQCLLALGGGISAVVLLFQGKNSKKETNPPPTPNRVPSILGTPSRSRLRRQSGSNHSGITADNTNGDSSDQIQGHDPRLRAMTPRRVKRRSARSLQSQKFGRNARNQGSVDRSSLRSHRSSKRRQNQNLRENSNQFVSPVNRLIQQVQQLDSEDTSAHYEPPGGYSVNNGVPNPAFVPPRPPSARSSYSNYHPARLPPAQPNHVFNLNQNIFTNGAFDMSTEYIDGSQIDEQGMNWNANNNLEQVNYLPDPSQQQQQNQQQLKPRLKAVMGGTGGGTMNTNTTLALTSPPQSSNASSSNMADTPKYPSGFSFNFNPHPNSKPQVQKKIGGQGQSGNYVNAGARDNQQPFAYPLAHSPISQDSFPIWGTSQPPHSPVVQNLPMATQPSQSTAARRVPNLISGPPSGSNSGVRSPPPYQNPSSFQSRAAGYSGGGQYNRQYQYQGQGQQPTSSETAM